MKLNKTKVAEPIDEINIEPVAIETEETVEFIEEPEVIFEPKDGIVSGCTSLYVRIAPHANGTPIDTLNAGSKVKIIGEEGDFWKLESPEGFSMKKFITLI